MVLAASGVISALLMLNRARGVSSSTGLSGMSAVDRCSPRQDAGQR
jgi:hypothetical protein